MDESIRFGALNEWHLKNFHEFIKLLSFEKFGYGSAVNFYSDIDALMVDSPHPSNRNESELRFFVNILRQIRGVPASGMSSAVNRASHQNGLKSAVVHCSGCHPGKVLLTGNP